MLDLRLGEPIPTDIPPSEPVNTADVQGKVMQWCDRLSGPPQTPYKLVPIPRLFDQLLLLPMRLGLSVLLTSTAMVVSPMTIANQGPYASCLTQ